MKGKVLASLGMASSVAAISLVTFCIPKLILFVMSLASFFALTALIQAGEALITFLWLFNGGPPLGLNVVQAL